ncbi:Shikimate dehydrogenase substrate binding domain protein [Pseudonocardia dioxanivorans CB1190]|uniref:Shikimate dehydrogenase substrate binding domain protein n=3 Tax=Pseudonocardia TaxID=1847 RepID=F4D0W0_PSEUX|nr:Shikimate dehydrogenase substrate binding domain protein [Pseudonocardia dioxanivorans CB1190]
MRILPDMPVEPAAPEQTGPVRRAAVLGSPVAHSLSPVLHRAAYAALGLTGWEYGLHECDEAGLPAFVEGLDATWAGLSLTMPLKRVALDVADTVSDLAAATGAANTLVLSAAGRVAENTDVAGIVAALREAGVRTARDAVVLGAGGTARAALAALRDLGDPAPRVLVRDPARAADLRTAAERLGVSPDVRADLADPRVAMGTLAGAGVVVSTLPPGAADVLVDTVWTPGTAVLDAVYAGWPTPLARSAGVAGCAVVSGLSMLLHQAVAQVTLMTGHAGPVEPMRAALDAAVSTPQGATRV